jgi:hypothetical protein
LPVVAAGLAINGLLLVPLVARFQSLPLTWLAVEALLLPLAFAALPRARGSRALAALAGAGVVSVTLLGLGQAATQLVLLRPLNVYLDWRLLGFAHDLLTANLGMAGALALEGVTVITIVAVWWTVTRLLTAACGSLRTRWQRLVGGLVAVVAAISLVSSTVRAYWPAAFAPSVRLVGEQVERGIASYAEMQRFGARLAASDARAQPLPELADTDVIVAFVESYGVSAHRDRRYASVVEPALSALQAAVADQGLSMVTGQLISPVQGGQSWLAHGTAISGLWLDNQIRYELMLDQNVPTLIDDFRRTGHRSVGVFPAITRAWPDGQRLGYDAVHSRPTIDYRGPRLNWVTMPDQFTWAWFQRNVRDASNGAVFAEIALISSHAPWTPILPVLEDWRRIGDGSVFEDWRDAGPAPSQLWRDPQRVGQYFARSLDYALTVAAGYTRRHVDESTVLILLGDHQPAPLITGDGASRAVPVHVISGNEALLEPFRGHGFREGAAIPEGPAASRLSALRGWLIDAFGADGGGGARAAPDA